MLCGLRATFATLLPLLLIYSTLLPCYPATSLPLLPYYPTTLLPTTYLLYYFQERIGSLSVIAE